MPDDWMTPETAEKIFSALAREKYLEGIHIAGGEPTMNWPRLLDIIRLAVKMQIRIEYMETNASWCGSRETTQKKMIELREAGLKSLLVSVSMFHAEFVPFSSTRNCVEVAREVLGDDNVILYLPHMYHMLAEMPGEGKHKLEEFCRHHAIKPWTNSMLHLYDVVPSGRAVTELRPCYQAKPAASYRDEKCYSDLLSTTHFHIDHEGNLFTGCCAGIIPASVPDLHLRITSSTHPVFVMLAEHGPDGLAEKIGKENGFSPRPKGYVSKCDLCLDVRGHLSRTGRFSELKPAYFYEE